MSDTMIVRPAELAAPRRIDFIECQVCARRAVGLLVDITTGLCRDCEPVIRPTLAGAR
jgi:hypothetical protein